MREAAEAAVAPLPPLPAAEEELLVVAFGVRSDVGDPSLSSLRTASGGGLVRFLASLLSAVEAAAAGEATKGTGVGGEKGEDEEAPSARGARRRSIR